MKESYQSGSLPEKKDKSIKNTIGRVGVGIAATVASLSIPNDAVAQHGLLGKIKDKINNTIELVSNKGTQGTVEEVKKDSTFYNGPEDKIGFKYPFDKEYKSDDDFYRGVVYVQDYFLEGATEDITYKAIDKVKNETGINASILDIKTLKQEVFKNEKQI